MCRPSGGWKGHPDNNAIGDYIKLHSDRFNYLTGFVYSYPPNAKWDPVYIGYHEWVIVVGVSSGNVTHAQQELPRRLGPNVCAVPIALSSAQILAAQHRHHIIGEGQVEPHLYDRGERVPARLSQTRHSHRSAVREVPEGGPNGHPARPLAASRQRLTALVPSSGRLSCVRTLAQEFADGGDADVARTVWRCMDMRARSVATMAPSCSDAATAAHAWNRPVRLLLSTTGTLSESRMGRWPESRINAGR